MPNELLNFYLPLSFLQESSALSSSWANKQYRFHRDELYVLASICITDMTFGELSIHLDRIENIPRSIKLRELQWRVQLVTYSGFTKVNSSGQVLALQADGLLNRQVGERIEYGIGECKEIELDREINLHLQIKDLFSGENSLDNNIKSLYQDQDMYLMLELVAFDDNNMLEYILGEKSFSLFTLI